MSSVNCNDKEACSKGDLSKASIITFFKSPDALRHMSLKQWNDLVFILRAENMLARFYALLVRHHMTSIIPKPALRHFVNAYRMSAKQNNITAKEALSLTTSLSEKSAFVVFLKGAGYAVSNSPASMGRSYSDIDILVPQKQLASVESFLTMFGWVSAELEDYDEQYYRKWAHEIPPMTHHSRGTVLDIHHNLIPPVTGIHFDINGFVDEYQEKVNGVTVLKDVAKFYHSAIHLFFNEDMSSAFRDMTDLYLLATSGDSQPFFNDVLSIATNYGFEREQMLAIYFLNRQYGVAVPDELAARLTQMEKGLSGLEIKLLSHLVLPKHALLKGGDVGMLQLIGEVRGHMKKMPPHILTYHLIMKSYRGLAKLLFGKHVFLKEEQK